MNMASWMNEDPQALRTWMMSGFIEPWMTKASLPAPDYIDSTPSEDAPSTEEADSKTGGLPTSSDGSDSEEAAGNEAVGDQPDGDAPPPDGPV